MATCDGRPMRGVIPDPCRARLGATCSPAGATRCCPAPRPPRPPRPPGAALPGLRHICHGATRRAMPCNTVAALRKWRVLAWQGETRENYRKSSGVVGEERLFQSVSIYFNLFHISVLRIF